MKKGIVFLLLLLLLFSVCAAPAAAAEAAPAEAEREETGLSARERQVAGWQEDYALLWTELEESYPYLSWLASRGLDIPAIRESFAAEIPTLRDDAAFADLVRRLTRALGNFAHVDLLPPEMYQTYCYAYVSGGLDAGAEGEAFAAVLQDPRLDGRYQPPAEAGEYLQAEAGSFPKVRISYRSELKTLIFHIRTFAQETVERDRDLVLRTIGQYPETEHIVFDLSGNSGGSDLYWMENIVAPFGGSWEFSYRNYFKSSDTVERYWGFIPSEETASLPDAPSWALSLGLDRCFSARFELPGEEYDGPTADCAAKRWVVIDESVFSASDKFAAFCRATGWATLVGRASRGDGLGSTPILILLPNSGLLVRFSATAGENPDGTMNAAVGTVPNYLCKNRETPLNRCLDLIRRFSE